MTDWSKPEWQAFEEVEAPTIDSALVSDAIATVKDGPGFATIAGWAIADRHSDNGDVRERWIAGAQHNGHRIEQLLETKPDGHDLSGRRWYSSLLYAAPPDPIYRRDSLVGILSVFGHIGCLHGFDEQLLMPLIQQLGRRGHHLAVPLVVDASPHFEDVADLYLLLPTKAQVVDRLHRWEGR
ncbi:hypothetical protein [Actinoplanes sp. NPDC026619]|uniref:hypothetical protein n=1 Tax=Actinoplanes sp. NPDC026619 TaxID=3155798 RepID=UPI0033D3ED7C